MRMEETGNQAKENTGKSKKKTIVRPVGNQI